MFEAIKRFFSSFGGKLKNAQEDLEQKTVETNSKVITEQDVLTGNLENPVNSTQSVEKTVKADGANDVALDSYYNTGLVGDEPLMPPVIVPPTIVQVEEVEEVKPPRKPREKKAPAKAPAKKPAVKKTAPVKKAPAKPRTKK